MATIINNPGSREPERAVLVESADNSAGWAVAVVILIAVIIGGLYWYSHHRATAPASGGTNINVTLPASGGTTQTTTQ